MSHFGLLEANPNMQKEHQRDLLFCQLMDSIYRFEEQRCRLDLQSSVSLAGQKYQESLLWYHGMLEETSGADGYCPLLQ